MQRRPEPLQTTRMLGAGLFLWLLYAVIAVWNPSASSAHVVGFITAVADLARYGGLILLLVGMFLRATAWATAWREGTDGLYEQPADVVVSERMDFPAEDDPDY
jgi:hypothetical protein